MIDGDFGLLSPVSASPAVAERWHAFPGLGDDPGGVTGMLLLAESHLAVHTWPPAELFSIYLAMAIVLVFRPEGLFIRVKARRI